MYSRCDTFCKEGALAHPLVNVLGRTVNSDEQGVQLGVQNPVDVFRRQQCRIRGNSQVRNLRFGKYNSIEQSGVHQRFAEPVKPARRGEEGGLIQNTLEEFGIHMPYVAGHDIWFATRAHDALDVAIIGAFYSENLG